MQKQEQADVCYFEISKSQQQISLKDCQLSNLQFNLLEHYNTNQYYQHNTIQSENKNNKQLYIYINNSMSKVVDNSAIKVQLTTNAQKQLQAHAEQILRREQQQMRDKIQRDQIKYTKVKEIQDNFVKWVHKKTEDNQLKFEKVEKNKQQQIAKIIKRCKEREKFVHKKQEDFKVKKKKNLNVAWKQAQKFNDSIQNYYKSKHIHNKTSHIFHTGAISPSNDNVDNIQRNQRHTESLAPKSANNRSINVLGSNKIYSPLNNNSTLYINKQANYISAPANQYANRFTRVQSVGAQYQYQFKEKEKSEHILSRHQQLEKKREDGLIQQLGKKLEKIEQTRLRKLKNHQKKSSKQLNESRDRNNEDNSKKLQKKNLRKLDNRIHSEQSHKKQSRLKDRTLDAKMKRQQLFQQHLLEGYEYLQNVKIRHLKTVISKNIAYNAIQKKLYMDRMNN